MSLTSTIASNAHDFAVTNDDGIAIYYNKVSSTEVSVTSCEEKYSGNVVIPSKVLYDGESYSVTSIESFAFHWCADLTSVIIPFGITAIGNYAFYSCVNLTSVSLPDSTFSLGDYSFSDCRKLKDVSIGNSVEKIGAGAFSWCRKLTTINIPDSVTSIEDEVFEYCDGLTSVVLGSSLEYLGSYAFKECLGIRELICRSKSPSKISFGVQIFNNYNCSLYVPQGSKGLYVKANEWRCFKDIFGIGDIDKDGNISVSDMTMMIDMIMSGETKSYADVDADGSVNIGDVTALVDILLDE